MLINAELLLQYQRCKRRPYLDIHGDLKQRDKPTDLLIKLQQDKISHKKSILARRNYLRPTYQYGDWQTGASATLELMEQGVECIYQGVLLANYTDIDWCHYALTSENNEYQNSSEIITTNVIESYDRSAYTGTNLEVDIFNTSQSSSFIASSPYYPAQISSHQPTPIPTIDLTREYQMVSCPDLLIKQPGKSRFGDWIYVPATIELGKRPKQEYQIVAAYHAQVLGIVQEVQPEVAYLMLRGKEANYPVDLQRWAVGMQRILLECVESMESSTAPDLFISRQKCSLCCWYKDCYTIASEQQHLSLLPGVTPVRYQELQALNITTPELLARTNPADLENLPGFDSQIATKIVIQAQSIAENRPLLLPQSARRLESDDTGYSPLFTSLSALRPNHIASKNIRNSSDIELYFDIEAQPDLDLNYLLGVLVVNKITNTERFYSFLAEKPEDEESVWHQFVDLVSQYPDAPIYHFCIYEFDTVKRLAKLYHTSYSSVIPILSRFVDVYEELITNVALPIESYALKAIARWLGFEWRDSEASGAKCIYWYDQWLKTSDRTLLEIIQRYNEDDCRATRSVKDWLAEFLE
jgi:predicted RecB family nuclease